MPCVAQVDERRNQMNGMLHFIPRNRRTDKEGVKTRNEHISSCVDQVWLGDENVERGTRCTTHL